VVIDDLASAVRSLQQFARPGELTARISDLESGLSGRERSAALEMLLNERVTETMLAGAVEVKRVAGDNDLAVPEVRN